CRLVCFSVEFAWRQAFLVDYPLLASGPYFRAGTGESEILIFHTLPSQDFAAAVASLRELSPRFLGFSPQFLRAAIPQESALPNVACRLGELLYAHSVLTALRRRLECAAWTRRYREPLKCPIEEIWWWQSSSICPRIPRQALFIPLL